MAVVLEEFGVYSDVADLFELVVTVELVVVGVNGTAEGESILVSGVWECVEMNLEGVEDAEEVEGVFVSDAQFGESVA